MIDQAVTQLGGLAADFAGLATLAIAIVALFALFGVAKSMIIRSTDDYGGSDQLRRYETRDRWAGYKSEARPRGHLP